MPPSHFQQLPFHTSQATVLPLFWRVFDPQERLLRGLSVRSGERNLPSANPLPLAFFRTQVIIYYYCICIPACRLQWLSRNTCGSIHRDAHKQFYDKRCVVPALLPDRWVANAKFLKGFPLHRTRFGSVRGTALAGPVYTYGSLSSFRHTCRSFMSCPS